MTFFGKYRTNSFFDQQALKRVQMQKNERRKRQTVLIFRLILVFTVGLVLLNLAFRLPAIYTKFAKPFQNLQSEFYRDVRIDFSNRTNLLLIGTANQELKELALASIEPGRKKIILLSLAPETLVFGKEQPKKLSDLVVFKQNNPENIEQLAAATLEILGYFSDGYILLSDSSAWISKKNLNQFVENSTFSPNFIFNLTKNKKYLDEHLFTNLTIGEFYTLNTQIKKIPPERFDFVDTREFLNKQGFIESQKLLNEVSVKLNDSKVAEGNYAVEIINSSGVGGLGSVIKNLVSNLGANVVSVSSTPNLQTESKILVKEKNNHLAKRLETVLKTKMQVGKTDSLDVRIILGEDFGKFFDY